MGKKIEKISGKDFCNPNGQYACSPSMHDIGRLQVKINEIIEWIEEQEKELPEPVIRETIKPSLGDTELVFERCDKNLLDSIFDKDKRDEEEKKFAPYFDNDYRCPECQEELLVTCRHPLELYCTCCQRNINLDEMEEELTFVKETLPQKRVENNTGEWEDEFDHFFMQGQFSDVCIDKGELKDFVRELLKRGRN